ncbi:MAG: hypothetical protein ABI462_11900 [Ignavibacteria bacterium]
MKAQTFIFTVLIFLSTISFLPGNSKGSSLNTVQSVTESITNVSGDGLTYVRVFKDGIWYIYVYDGEILITVYPE